MTEELPDIAISSMFPCIVVDTPALFDVSMVRCSSNLAVVSLFQWVYDPIFQYLMFPLLDVPDICSIYCCLIPGTNYDWIHPISVSLVSI